jgi:hypothetical protein
MPARSTAWNLTLSLMTSATLAAAVVSACARSSSAPADASALRNETGPWGGEHLELVVSDTGATLQYDCAHGTMSSPPKLDASGRFVVVGTHVLEHGGPIRVGEAEDRHAATYAGQVLGSTMTLTVQVSGISATLGPFTLRRGDAGRVYRCY